LLLLQLLLPLLVVKEMEKMLEKGSTTRVERPPPPRFGTTRFVAFLEKKIPTFLSF
jgi:hypothetical protein